MGEVEIYLLTIESPRSRWAAQGGCFGNQQWPCRDRPHHAWSKDQVLVQRKFDEWWKIRAMGKRLGVGREEGRQYRCSSPRNISFLTLSLSHSLTLTHSLTLSLAHRNILNSGSHFNPCVTLSMAMLGRITFVKGLLYVVAQLLGSVCGAACLLVRDRGTWLSIAIARKSFPDRLVPTFFLLSTLIYV